MWVFNGPGRLTAPLPFGSPAIFQYLTRPKAFELEERIRPGLPGQSLADGAMQEFAGFNDFGLGAILGSFRLISDP